MSRYIARYWHWVVAISAASFVAGVVVGPIVTSAVPSLATDKVRTAEVEEFSKEIGEEIERLGNEINAIKNRSDAQLPQISEEITDLEKQIQIIDARIDRLSRLSNDIDDLKKEIASLRTSPLQSLSASLDRSEYRTGDSLVVTGTSAPNTSVKTSLLDPNRLSINEGSTISDSTGKFMFTFRLPEGLSTGNYIIKITEGSNTIERMFRIVSTQVQTEGFTIRTDSSEYLRGERVQLSGTATQNTWVDLDIFDSNNVQLVRTSTKSDTNGRYSLEYIIAFNSPLGEYVAKASAGDKQVSVKFFVVNIKSSSSSITSSNLTITTEKTTYNRGNFVTVTGKSMPGEKVTIFVEPTGGDRLVLTVNSDSSGNYRTIFEIRQDAFGGQWKLTAKQGTDTATINITVI
ncbi:MAG: hypothetical protein QXU32_09350 [Nitrososphaerales archaeon]